MSIDLEYAIKKDIRNNPIVREIDLRQKHEFLRMACLTGLIVVMLLVWAWQHAVVVQTGYALESKRKEQAVAAETNRQLRLELETQWAPQLLAIRAVRELHMMPPGAGETIVIERTTAAKASKAVVAAVR